MTAATADPLFDSRIVTKPKTLGTSDRANWSDWKFSFEFYDLDPARVFQ